MSIKTILAYYQQQPVCVRCYLIVRSFILNFKKIFAYFPLHVDSIMELGCGYGMASFMLARRYENIPIRSFDIDQNRIAILNSINPFQYLSFHTKNIIEIQQFDAGVIFMSDLLHHLPYHQQEALLKKIFDTSPAGATVIVKDMDRGHRSFRQWCNYIIDRWHTKETRFYYHDKAGFLNLFAVCGYKVKQCDYINKWFIPLNHILFVLEKNGDNS